MARRRGWVLALAGSGLLLGLGCEAGEQPPTPAPPAREQAPPAQASAAAASTSAAEAEARQIFATRCTTCHGPAGGGDGPGSAALNPPPRDFRDPEWQASVTDAHIEQIIQYGGAAVGRSPAMPGNPDLTAKPQVVAELRAYVRSLATP